jgi:hypothetical protein
MITEDYVSLEVAKLLKEKGFDEPCRLYYDKYHGYVPVFVEDSKLTEYGYKELVRNDQNNISDFIASAPSLYVAMKWLREACAIEISIACFKLDSYRYDIYAINSSYFRRQIIEFNSDEFCSYGEAVEAALKYCLKNLI